MQHNLAYSEWYGTELTSDVQIRGKSDSGRSYFRVWTSDRLEL